MKKKSGYKPYKKTISYMRKMINIGKWKSNSRIPTLATISMKVGASIPTIRKAIKQLEFERLIDNNGSLGYNVIPLSITKLFHSDKQLYYLYLLKSNISAIKLLNNNAISLGRYIIQNYNNNLKVHDVISGKMLNTTWSELENTLNNPISIDYLIKLTGIDLSENKKKYLKQQELRDIAKVLIKNKEIII